MYIVIIASTLCGCEGESTPITPQAQRPNILLLLADDLGYNDITIYNNNQAVHTPTLDQFAQQGIRYTRHYTYSTCSPSRAALLTGMNPARLGFNPNGRGISPDITTLADNLKEQGYRTHHVGKWHTGDTLPAAYPDAQGFDSWFGFLNQWRLKGKKSNGEIVLRSPTYINPWLRTEFEPEQQYKGHLTNLLTAHTIKQIKALKGERPWFINVWFYAPHNPVTPGEKYAKLYPDTKEGEYHALIHQLDSSVEKILQALSNSGQADNTIVIFASDNGGTNEATDNNSPYPGHKATYHEGGVRTPMMIRWPGKIKANTVSNEVVAIYDIYPTLVSLLELTPQDNFDGIDFSPTLKGKTLPDRQLFWERVAHRKFGYSVVSADGVWRINKSWPWVKWDSPPTLTDLTQLPMLPKPATGDGQQLARQLDQAYYGWHQDIHTPTFKQQLNGDELQLSGQDFIRSPGFNGFTFAVGLLPDKHIDGRYPDSELVANQGRLWKLEVTAENKIIASFGKHQLSADWHEPETCTALIVTGNFNQRLNSWENNDDRIAIEMYLNGQIVDTYTSPGKLDHMEDLPEATLINRRWLYQQRAPLILTKMATDTEPYDIARINQIICPDDDPELSRTGQKAELAM